MIKPRPRKFHFKAGDKSGKWTVLGFNQDESLRVKETCYDVECSCGTKKTHTQATLRLGRSLGCQGCVEMKGIPKKRDKSGSCVICGSPFDPYAHHGRLYCSQRCISEGGSRRKNERCRDSIETSLYLILKDAAPRAKRKGLACTVSLDYLMDMYKIQDGKCALSGVRLKPKMRPTDGERMNWDSITVDRIDVKRGYEEGNVRLVTNLVNVARNAFRDDLFLEMCRNVVAQHGR